MSGDVAKYNPIPEADNNSIKAKSLNHSLGSSYWHINQQKHIAKPGQRVSNDNLEILSRLSNDRKSLLSTPLVEFDSLG